MFAIESATKGCNIDCFYRQVGKDKAFLQFFTNTHLSRGKWSEVLVIERSTIWRWEKEVIQKVQPIKEEYWGFHPRLYYLDPYQRFLIAYIHSLKEGTNISYCSVQDVLRENIGQLQRDEFESWRKVLKLV